MNADDSRWSEVDAYITAKLHPADDALEATLRNSAAEGLPPIAVSPPQGRLLQLLASAIGARTALEIGTLGGYSSIWLARGLVPGGRLTTLELSPGNARVAAENIRRAGLHDMVEIRVGRALDTLAELAREGAGPFDITFIDADKVNTPAYFEWALRLSRPGSAIVVDNVVREGKLIDPESDDPNVRGVRELHELVARTPEVRATTIQTVGSKGYDGFLLATVGSK